jgi:hypothetical protein
MAILPLPNMPDDVKDYILDVQRDLKKQKKIQQISQPSTIYHIIREHKKLTEKKN